MATYNNNSGTGGHAEVANVPYMLEEILDFGNVTTTADVALTPGSSDVWEVLNIPAGTIVLMAGVDVLTAETGNTGTKVALGDGSATYVGALVISSTGQLAGVDAVGEIGVAYDAANTLDITSSVSAPTDGVIRVWAVVVDATSPDVTQRQKFTTA